MKPNLSNVTLVCVDCSRHAEALAAIRKSMTECDFASVKFLTDRKFHFTDIEIVIIPSIKSKEEYSEFIIKKLNYFFQTEYVLVCQHDGYVLDGNCWDDDFLKYDYIGAPWPSEESWISLQHQDQQSLMKEVFPKNRVGNGGFCLRSRKFLEFSAQYDSCNGLGEDSFLCTRKYYEAIEYGIKFAPFELAAKFSYENPCIEYGTSWNQPLQFDKTKHFGWHGSNFTNTNELMALKYQ